MQPWLFQFLCSEILKNPVGLRMWALITLIYVAILIEVILLSGGVPTTRAHKDFQSLGPLFDRQTFLIRNIYNLINSQHNHLFIKTIISSIFKLRMEKTKN